LFAFDLTPTITENIAAIERARDRLGRRTTLATGWQGRLRREFEAQAVAASTSMEGVPVTVAEVVRILAGDRPAAVALGDADLVLGYRDAVRHAFVRGAAPDFTWNPELLLALHGMAMGASRHASPGSFRTGAVWVANSSTGEVVYECPDAEHVPGLVEALCHRINALEGPAPVSAALVHVGIARIHPFRDGNGRVARIAASLAMSRGGYSAPEFTSLEEWWGRHCGDYYGALRRLGPRWDANADLTAFIEAHTGAQRQQVASLGLSEQVERAIWTALENIVHGQLGMPTRIADVLYDAFFGRSVTNRYYRSIANVSAATAVNDLARLESSGLIRAEGAGRSREYAGTFRLLALTASECRVSIDADPDTALDDQRRMMMRQLAERLGGDP
jgi:Fic family protein